ncbi:MAG: serine/threonine protein kinase [Myxococcota bacterium]
MAEQRYRVVERLEAGGMAEVFKGEATSVQGFKKRVAIKRVLPHLAQNKNFIGMFLDEARLGARLNHANIVTVFDIGAADNTYFIVMEFVDGGNLKSIMEALRKQGRTFPAKEAIYIAMETLHGLSYAHELTNEEGELMHLVHRDMSPPNILLSKRGEVKVTDFGLAKATTQLEKTDPGVVKGKFSYLSPEAALGQDVDARADVFALGVVLWEMLAGRRLFLGETDYQTVKLVQQANVPSISKLNPEVDEEFEQVLNGALTRDPNDRYQSAAEFGDALAGYLFSHRMKVTSYDIANLVKQTIGREPKAKPQDQSIIDRLIQEEMVRFTSIDEMNDPLDLEAKPLTEGGVEGSQPLDLGSFENPADWFAGEELGNMLEGEQPREDSQAGWHESGLENPPESEGGGLASLLEDDTGTARAQEPAAPPPAATPPARTGTGPMPADEGGAGAWKLVLLLLVLLVGAGAAAWFGDVIPR